MLDALTFANGVWQINYKFSRDLGLKRAHSVIDVAEQRGGVIFHFHDHYERFIKSCKGWLIPTENFPPEDALLEKAIWLLRGFGGARLVWLQATGGETQDTKNPSGLPTLSISIHPFPDVSAKSFKLKTLNYKRDFPSFKHTSGYGIARRLEAEARSQGFDKFLYWNACLGVLEGAYENVLFVTKEGKLLAPNTDILEGITRKIVLDLARASKIFTEIIERPVHLYQLDYCDECFVTSTTLGVAEVSLVNAHRFPHNIYTRKLKELFLEYRENYYKERGA